MDPNKPLNLLTIDEAAAELRVDKRTLYRFMNEGTLQARRLRSADKVLIDRADLIAMLEAWSPKEKGFRLSKGKAAKGDTEELRQPQQQPEVRR